MNRYIVLLRGINVGGKNKVSMSELRQVLTQDGCSEVITYINSGNIILRSNKSQAEIEARIESLLPKHFTLDSEIIKVLVLTETQLRKVISNKPKGFGAYPETYHSDVIFLIDIDEKEAATVFRPKAGVDIIWHANGVVYSQRVSKLRTKSRLNQIIASPLYKSMTIRNWNTTTKLLSLLEQE